MHNMEEYVNKKNNIKEHILKYSDLPLIIIFECKDGIKKEYILKANNENTKLLLNKKDL